VACGTKIVPGPTSQPAPSESDEAAPLRDDEEPEEATPPSEFDAETPTAGAPASEPPEEVESIPVPDDIMSGLVARGQQLALEDQYVKSKSVSDDLIENLSEAATNGSSPLEELIDTYVNERSEQERLEGLHESGEVSDDVYDRLTREYDDKLTRMDEKIREGVTTLRAYQVHLRAELVKTEEELETAETKEEVGDEETDVEERQATLTDQIQRLRWAIAAATHILEKEAALHGEPASRFEVSETTVASAGSEDGGKPVSVKPSTTRPPKPSVDVEAGKICPSCGGVTAANMRFCVHCGSRI
jgi:hypothetical protein